MTAPAPLPSSAVPRRELAVVAGLVVSGAVLRLWGLRQMEFKGDEMESLKLGMQLLDARPWATGAPWPRVGLVSSGGLYNPPFYNWLIALFWALTGSPLGATACIAVLNIVSLPPLYLWARRVVGSPRALLVLAWCAVSPFAVFYSRKLWPPELLLPGLVLLLWSIEWLRGERFWRGVAAFIFAMLPLSHLHLSGPVLGFCLLVLLAVQWFVDRSNGRVWHIGRPRGVDVALLALAVGAVVFFSVPYLQYLWSQPARAFGGAKKNAWPLPDFLVNLARTVMPFEVEHHFSGHWREFLSQSTSGAWSRAARFGGLVVAVLTGIPVLVLGAYGWLCRPQRVPVLGMAWWMFIILFTLLTFHVFPQYVLVLMPLPALLVAGAFEDGTAHPVASVLRWCHVAALFLLTAGAVEWVTARGGSAGDYGIGYGMRRAQADAVVALLDGRSNVPTSNTIMTDGLQCHSPTWELDWVMRLVARGVRPELEPMVRNALVCDRWIERDGVTVYEWMVRLR